MTEFLILAVLVVAAGAFFYFKKHGTPEAIKGIEDKVRARLPDEAPTWTNTPPKPQERPVPVVTRATPPAPSSGPTKEMDYAAMYLRMPPGQRAYYPTPEQMDYAIMYMNLPLGQRAYYPTPNDAAFRDAQVLAYQATTANTKDRVWNDPNIPFNATAGEGDYVKIKDFPYSGKIAIPAGFSGRKELFWSLTTPPVPSPTQPSKLDITIAGQPCNTTTGDLTPFAGTNVDCTIAADQPGAITFQLVGGKVA